MEKRIETLELKVADLEQKLTDLMVKLKISDELTEELEWKSNSAGEWSIKVVYPGIYQEGRTPTAGFPKNRKKTAEQVSPGQAMFVYVTSPIKKIIGMTRVVSSMKQVGGQWPYSVDLDWVIGPKQGVSFNDVDLGIRPRIGDTLYQINEDVAQRIIKKLEEQDDLTDEMIRYLANEYRDKYRVRVQFPEAVRKLRDAKMDSAADALEIEGRADDGSVRGWDEKIERGNLYRKFPKAREIIWPDRYGV